ncbi:hypothetical protein AWH56_020630 [Anaerobacillus isosaccharinicus]|uniref:Uncharacterized protein n=1 Tax=Anaerobacillus isosaccharinicus TaxID=1532552 RepID=A0A1S2ME43_9BACI|nr:hypothetical protein [Anaerobacillus isosaccharinicus]MBA5586687.1 hypothetical protein [Anaerobacillus isosaccharinicus]QOY35083.1 hypothetical protein AWH56_020630 [Anaerobacillus isosaccharinicus]
MSIENEPINSPVPKKRRMEERGKGNLLLKLAYILLAVIIWGGLLYGGYNVADNYFKEIHSYLDEEILEMKTQNEEVIEQLERFNEELQFSTEELTMITLELNVIKEALELTGETITGSDQTRFALQEKISELDKRLNQLTTQLIKLEEAARAH